MLHVPSMEGLGLTGPASAKCLFGCAAEKVRSAKARGNNGSLRAQKRIGQLPKVAMDVRGLAGERCE